MKEENRKDMLNVSGQRWICILVDWFTSFWAFFAFNVFRFFYMRLGDNAEDLGVYLFSPKLIAEQIFVPLLLLFVYWLSGYYNRPFERSRLHEFLITLYSQAFNSLVIYLGALTNDNVYLRSENWMLILVLFLLLFCFTYFGRLIVTQNMIGRLKRSNVRPRTVVIGLSPEAVETARKIINPKFKPNGEIIAFMRFGESEDEKAVKTAFPDTPVIPDTSSLIKFCKENNVDQIFIVPQRGKSSNDQVLYLLYQLFPLDISIRIRPDIISLITPTIRLQDILGEPYIDLTAPQMGEFSQNVKRTLDILISGVGLILLSPLMAFLALAVRRSGPGKIIYSQERVGLHRRPFKILKFRSMVSNAEKDGVPMLSSDDDSRITGIGRWMRKYRLDELPQFVNVLKGEMSLVGPRPERPYFIDQIVRKAPWYMLVLQVKPGITSWGMVKYGYASDIDQMIERNRFDLIYLANMSVAVDFKILIHTIKTVGAGEGK